MPKRSQRIIGVLVFCLLSATPSFAGAQSAQGAPPAKVEEQASGTSTSSSRQRTLGEMATAKDTGRPKTNAAPHFARPNQREGVGIPLTHVGVLDASYRNQRNPINVLSLPVPPTPAPIRAWPPAQLVGLVAAMGSTAEATAQTIRSASANYTQATKRLEDDKQNARHASTSADRSRAQDDIVAAKAELDKQLAEFLKTEVPVLRAWASRVDLVFQNRSGSRLVVSFTAFVPPNKDKSITATGDLSVRGFHEDFIQALIRAPGLSDETKKAISALPAATADRIHIGKCDDKNACKATLTIDPRQDGVVPVSLLVQFGDDGRTITQTPISFQVDFFSENATPTHHKGYFSVVPAESLQEPDDTASWSPSGTVGYERAPDVADDAIISATNPYQPTDKNDYPAKGLLTMDATLGGRAEASTDLKLKGGTLDGSEAGSVTVPRFQFDVHGIRPVTISFGHFEFADPASGLSIDEKGEGAQFAYQNFSLAAVFNSDGGPRLPDTQTQLDKAGIAQWANVSRPSWRPVEYINLFLQGGRVSYAAKTDNSTSTDSSSTPVDSSATAATPTLASLLAHSYGSVGGESFFNFDRPHIRGSLSGFYNWARPIHSSGFTSTSGASVDGTATFTKFGIVDDDSGARKIDFTVSTEVAWAGANAGEHQSYAPDNLLLSSFAPKVDPASDFGLGMAHKTYANLALTTKDCSWLSKGAHCSPLYWFARSFTPDSDIASDSTTFTIHHLSSTTGSFKGALGTEFDAECDVETPSQITTTFTYSYLRPEGVMKGVLGGRNSFWSLSLSMQIKFKS